MNDNHTEGEGVKCVLEFKPIWGLNFPDDFNLDAHSIESAPTLDWAVLLKEVLEADQRGRYRNEEMHHLTHALMLFQKLSQENAFDGIDTLSLFAACCDTVLIWSFG